MGGTLGGKADSAFGAAAAQRATFEVLRAMAASPDDPQPVFELIARHAAALCGTQQASVSEVDAGLIHLRATFGYEPAGYFPRPPSADNLHGRIALGEGMIHVPDTEAVAAPGIHRDLARRLDTRALLAVPMRCSDEIVGAIAVRRSTAGAFGAQEVELLEAFAEQAAIAIETARARREEREALARQTALAEVLAVINANPGELAPVFDAVLERAMRLCGVRYGSLYRFDGVHFHSAAHRGLPEAFVAARSQGPVAPTPGSIADRMLVERRSVQAADITNDPIHRTGAAVDRAPGDLGGIRAMLLVPLLREGGVIGHITLSRPEAGDFTSRQVALVEAFADQAVNAIESARLLTDLRQSLEYQTAISDVLKVISRSTFDLQPVLETLLAAAARLCDADSGGIATLEGEGAGAGVRVATHWSRDGSYRTSTLGQLLPLNRATILGRTALEGRIVHVADVGADPDHVSPDTNRPAPRGTMLGVPLLRDGAVLGSIRLARDVVHPFTARQVAVVSTFADQAVIAIGNTRLLTEQREALARQTATAEVLQVINASPGNLAPVFEAMLDKAMRLSGIDFGLLRDFDGEVLRLLASRGVPAPFADFIGTRDLWRPLGNMGDALTSCRPCQTLDMRKDPFYAEGNVGIRAIVDLGGARTLLHVPLVKDGRSVGLFTFFRQEVRAFSDKEIALLESFAAQAVIAMENARLLTEQREALERQTATAEVLAVINANPGNLAPVFDTVLDRSFQLCEARFGFLYTFDGERFEIAAQRNIPDAYAEYRRTNPTVTPTPGDPRREVLRTRRPVHIHDFLTVEDYGESRGKFLALTGARTVLVVPLLKEGAVAGVIAVFRQDVLPFSDRHIALLESFAAQAVIAMDNARLLTEQREALARQTAMSDILAAINANPGDPQPAFDIILTRAHEICGADLGTLLIREPGGFRGVAIFGYPSEVAAQLREVNSFDDNPDVQALRDGARYFTVADVKAAAGPVQDPVQAAIRSKSAVRTSMVIPLRRDKELAGILTAHRTVVRPYTESEITLLESFAAQAVIAIENARLLSELRVRDEDNRRLISRQSASIEILRAISASPDDPQPVFETIVRQAISLCGGKVASVAEFDGELLRMRAIAGADAESRERLMAQYPTAPRPEILLGRVVLTGEMVHVRDTLADPRMSAFNRAIAEQNDFRTSLTLPLVREGRPVGGMAITRQQAGGFADDELAMLQSFAEQAVIAISGAQALRTLRARTEELAQSQDELRVTFENMNDGVALFDAGRRLVAWNANFLRILDLPDDSVTPGLTIDQYIRMLAARGEYGAGADAEEQVTRVLALAGQRRSFERGRPGGRTVEIRSNPVADGGFVLIYADITERKRAEAEIAAARDAAEQATRTIEAAYRELKVAQANLVQAEKMASLGQLTAGIAHEIKNPLNFVNNFAGLSVELLGEFRQVTAPGLESLDEDARAEADDLSATLTANLAKIAEHGKRADSIVRSMLEHSRGSSTERRAVDFNALVEEALNLAFHGARAQDQRFNITLERAYAPDLAPIEVNPQDITRVLLNLFGNGFYAAGKRARDNPAPGFAPTLTVSTHARDGAVEVRVRDNGIGVPADIRDKLFQPFFTTKPTGEGTGLGLSITWDVVTKQHGGTITVDSEVGQFTEFTVTLPRDGAAR